MHETRKRKRRGEGLVRRERRWVRVKALAPEVKAAVAVTCDRFIAETLKPRFLPKIRPTPFDGPIDIFGRWRGNKYSFIARYRSGFPDNPGEEIAVAFARLDHVEECITETRFDLMWHRHTGTWWRLHPSVLLEEALRLIATQPLLQPPA
jgi:hypothetical protein